MSRRRHFFTIFSPFYFIFCIKFILQDQVLVTLSVWFILEIIVQEIFVGIWDKFICSVSDEIPKIRILQLFGVEVVSVFYPFALEHFKYIVFLIFKSLLEASDIGERSAKNSFNPSFSVYPLQGAFWSVGKVPVKGEFGDEEIPGHQFNI